MHKCEYSLRIFVNPSSIPVLVGIFYENILLREDKMPVLVDFEHARPIESTDHIAGDMASIGRLFLGNNGRKEV